MAKKISAADLHVRGALTAGLAAVLAGGVAQSAMAQSAFDRSRNVEVLERAHPEYDALGVRVGSFIAYPKVETGVSRDDNVFAADTAPVDSTVVSVRPSITVQSGWSRHSLEFSASAAHDKYSGLEFEDSTTWQTELSGRADARRDATLTGLLSYSHNVEPRGASSYVVVTREPIEYDLARLNFGAVKEFNRVRVSGRVNSSDFDYDDGLSFGGVAVDQDYRDFTSSGLTGRVDFALSSATAMFAEIRAGKIDYDQAASQPRNSDDLRALTGVSFEITDLVTGEASIGYLERSYDGPRGDLSRFAYRASVNWFPSPLLTFGLDAERIADESPLASTPTYVSDTVSLTADYEFRRNVILSARLSALRDDYVGIDRKDDTHEARLAATYLLNRTAGVSFTYSFTDQDSNGLARGVDYSRRVAGLVLVLQR